MIIQNAHRINKGNLPETDNQNDDFFFFGQEEPEAAGALLVDIVNKRIPEKFGFDSLSEVQVLAPMYNGRIGIDALNEALRETLNPKGSQPEKQYGHTVYRVGDKVMQLRNNYTKEVYNGDIGYVVEFDDEEEAMVVRFEDDMIVYYEKSEIEELTLAYAISVHKSQGSEYPVIVMPILTQHYMMLQRNLLYTAITRAKKLVVLVGTRKAIAMAVKNDKVAKRYSGLVWRLAY
jgi:exodeoxyribonuclease V alpha subunit